MDKKWSKLNSFTETKGIYSFSLHDLYFTAL